MCIITLGKHFVLQEVLLLFSDQILVMSEWVSVSLSFVDVVIVGKVWIKQMLMSAFLLPSMVCGTAFFINFIAIYYHASRAIPFGTMVSTVTGFL